MSSVLLIKHLLCYFFKSTIPCIYAIKYNYYYSSNLINNLWKLY
uniref:Uncharacterized protein n=1 Tax=viral metagenome TaxID=1070528 RepID=A0A6C0H9F1_9ZZZZ